jgi:hypothetical protein
LGTESIIFFGRLPQILTLLLLMAVAEVAELVQQELPERLAQLVLLEPVDILV